MDLINSFDSKKIILIEDKKNYRIRYSAVDKLIINISNAYSPFGIEKYNKKDILNIELTNNSNINNNIISLIKEIDNYFLNLGEIKSEFKNFIYTSPIKNISDEKINIRCHLSNKLKIKTKDNNPESFILKKKNFKIELEFSSIWLFNESYGIVLTINSIDLT